MIAPHPLKSKAPTLLWSLWGLALVVLIGLVDWVTGPEIALSIFYLVPVSLMTWMTDRPGGIASCCGKAAGP